MKRLNVDVRMNTTASVDMVKALDPYAVFVAPGAEPHIPNIPGLEDNNVSTIEDILSGRVVLKDQKVIVVGSGLTGLETAEYLAKTNNTVTIIEMQDEIAKGAYKPNVIDVVMRLQKDQVDMITNLQLEAINHKGIDVVNTLSKEKSSMEADAIILSLGVKVNHELVESFKSNLDNIFVLGDAREPGRIPQAMETAMDKAYIL